MVLGQYFQEFKNDDQKFKQNEEWLNGNFEKALATTKISTLYFQNSVLRGKYDDLESYSERAITVCSGLDMVNINLNHFVFKDRDTSEVWKHGLRKLTNNVKINNVCPTTALEKQ